MERGAVAGGVGAGDCGVSGMYRVGAGEPCGVKWAVGCEVGEVVCRGVGGVLLEGVGPGDPSV